MKFTDQEKEHIKNELTHRIHLLAPHLLGQPIRDLRNRRQLRFGSKNGSLWVNVDPAHKEYGKWYDFQEGRGGDALSLIQRVKGLNFVDALAWAKNDFLNLTSPLSQQAERSREKKNKRIWTPLHPVPEDVPDPDLNNAYLSFQIKGKEVTQRHAYLDQEGRRLGYVVRVESTDEKGNRIKEPLPLTYCRDEEGNTYWRWKGFDAPRPLYGLDQLKSDRPVLIVEGEKTADAAQHLFPDYTVITWSGGTQSVGKADWTPLNKKEVTIWPDHDEAGLKAARELSSILKAQGGKGTQVKLVQVPEAFPPKWDLADPLPEGVDFEQLKSLIHKAPAILASHQVDVGSLKPPTPESLLAQKLATYIEPFTKELFGDPKLRDERSLLFGDGGRLSVTRSGNDAGKWWDTRLKKGGDVLSLLTHPLSKAKDKFSSLKDGELYLQEWVESFEKSHPEALRQQSSKATIPWTPLEVVSETAPALYKVDSSGQRIYVDGLQNKTQKVLDAYPYLDQQSKVLGYRVQVEKTLTDGTKTTQTLPVRWCERPDPQTPGTPQRAWRNAKWEAPRPLFGLEQLTLKPTAKVLIVEGERAALEARSHFPEYAVLTWMTGTSEFKTDWSPLKGRDVMIWPSDPKVARRIGRHLLKQDRQDVRLIRLPDGTPKNWNFDAPLPEKWTPETLKTALTSTSQAWMDDLKKIEAEKSEKSASPEEKALKQAERKHAEDSQKTEPPHEKNPIEPLEKRDEVNSDSNPVTPSPQAAPAQISAIAALGQILSLPLEVTASLSRVAKEAVRSRLETYSAKMEAQRTHARQGELQALISSAQSFSKETTDLALKFRESEALKPFFEEMNREAAGNSQRLSEVVRSDDHSKRFAHILEENPGLKSRAHELQERLSTLEQKWRGVAEMSKKAKEDPHKIWKAFASEHQPLSEVLQEIPTFDGKKLLEMAQAVVDNLRRVFSSLFHFERGPKLNQP